MSADPGLAAGEGVEDAGVDEGAEVAGLGVGDELGPGVEVGVEVGASELDTGLVIPFGSTEEGVVGLMGFDEVEDVYEPGYVVEL
jgi:hypothetical protein